MYCCLRKSLAQVPAWLHGNVLASPWVGFKYARCISSVTMETESRPAQSSAGSDPSGNYGCCSAHHAEGAVYLVIQHAGDLHICHSVVRHQQAPGVTHKSEVSEHLTALHCAPAPQATTRASSRQLKSLACRLCHSPYQKPLCNTTSRASSGRIAEQRQGCARRRMSLLL